MFVRKFFVCLFVEHELDECFGGLVVVRSIGVVGRLVVCWVWWCFCWLFRC